MGLFTKYAKKKKIHLPLQGDNTSAIQHANADRFNPLESDYNPCTDERMKTQSGGPAAWTGPKRAYCGEYLT